MATRMTRRVSFPLALALLAGCDMEIERTGGPVMNEAQQASDALTPQAAAPAAPAAAPNGEETSPAAMPADVATAPPVGEQSDTHVGKSTKEVLNAKELTGDPNWTVVADDPSQVSGFSAAGTAYNRAAALGGTVNLGQWLKQEQALNGSWPTYQQLLDYIKMNPVDMPALREYQHYGYDETTGKIVILENQQEKAKRRGELGLPAQD